jgi:TM2 domain-containing membrane protein YozV
MTNALVKSSRRRRSGWSGVVPAACSAIVPGVGQLINGDTDKAIGVFVVAAISGVAFLGALPLIGPIAGLVSGATWLYAVGDGYLQGRKPR